MRTIEDKAFLLLIVAVSLALLWVVWSFLGAILWGTIIAILFAPLCRRLTTAFGDRRNLAALATVAAIVVIVILPMTLIGASLIREASGVYGRMRTGELDVALSIQRVLDALPAWATGLLGHLGLESLDAMRERLSENLMKGGQFLAERALGVGQSAFDFVANLFVMLYLLYFLLRDEAALFARIKGAIPLRLELQRALFLKFTVVIRATVKSDLLVAMLQGALGGAIFWALGIGAPLLWGVVMAFLSLLPVVGAGLVWAPVAIYLLATGAVWQGVVLMAYGALVIGLVDNFLRPILVGQDTKMPDFVVLISTLGGLATFGLNGFVLGPVIAALFIAVWDIVSATRREARSDATPG
ncbi:MAG: AI-2E family transporter [Rhodospirillales bacterium]|nr:MAG: AI-2E family transporter [Rhodospirillales bacterium]